MGEGTRIAVVATLVGMAFALGWLGRDRYAGAAPPVAATADPERARLEHELASTRERAEEASGRAAVLAQQQAEALERARERLAVIDAELARAGGSGSGSGEASGNGSGTGSDATAAVAALAATLATRERQLELALEEVARLEQVVELLQAAAGSR